MQDPSRARSLSLDDINIGVSSLSSSSSSSSGKASAVEGKRRWRDTTEEEDRDRDTLPELESPAIENLQDRLLLTPIRWQVRPDGAAGASAGLYRRDSAPATLLQKEDSISRRCSNPALLETIEEGQVSCRRKSTPAVIMPGLAQRGRGAGAHLSPRRAVLNAVTSPSAAPARRRSMPEISSHHKGTVTLETFYPPPRRNSLMSCSLSEVAARFELLNTHSRVPEESELLERSRAGYERKNGSSVTNRSLPPITL